MRKINKKIWIKILCAVLSAVLCVGGVLLGVYFGTQKEPSDYLELSYTDDWTDRLATVDRTEKYLAHPDLVQTDTGRLIAVYPAGHGRGSILMKYSDDFGQTWSERVDGLPSSWASSQETPTVYNLRFKDGSTKLILVSGCPYWSAGTRDGEYLPAAEANGFNFSYSDDGGQTWSEFENFYSPADCIVAMSSLTRLKENGEYVDRWMGTFHTHEFVNYKTILSFDEDGKASWSEPEPLLSEYREIEKKMGICEIEIIRNERNDALILLARAEKRTTRSAVSVSYDEGRTWTEPKETPTFLSGDRHKAEYDAKSGKVIVCFRQTTPEKPNALSSKEIMGDGWVGWIGTAEELYDIAIGKAAACGRLYLLGRHYGNWCDCGYGGIVCRDGKAALVSYGQFDEAAKNPYIVALTVDLEKA